MKALRAIYHFLVDSPRLALGALVAVAIAALVAATGPTGAAASGWLLFLLIVAAVADDIYRTLHPRHSPGRGASGRAGPAAGGSH
jgi:hypothetical protein